MQERHLASLQREQGRAFARKSFIQADNFIWLWNCFHFYFCFVLWFCFYTMNIYIYSIMSIQECLKNIQFYWSLCTCVFIFESFKGLGRAHWCWQTNQNPGNNVGLSLCVFWMRRDVGWEFECGCVWSGRDKQNLFGGGPETSHAVIHLEGALRSLHRREAQQFPVIAALSNPQLKVSVELKFTMKRGLTLVHLLTTFTVINGTPFQYNIFQGNAYSRTETQRNKWVLRINCMRAFLWQFYASR